MMREIDRTNSKQILSKQKDILHMWTSITLISSTNRETKVKDYTLPVQHTENQIKNPVLELLKDDDPSKVTQMFTCIVCQRKEKEPCLEHPYILLQDNKSSNIKGALGTVPWPLDVRKNTEGVKAVFTKADLPTRLLLGPYEGEIIVEADEGDTDIIGWRISSTQRPHMCVDASKKSRSNWLRYVQCSTSRVEANLEIFQYQGYIYYATKHSIKKNSELLVWYGDEYGEAFDLKIDEKPYGDISVEIEQTPPRNPNYNLACDMVAQAIEAKAFKSNIFTPLVPLTQNYKNPFFKRCPVCFQMFHFYNEYSAHYEQSDNMTCQICNSSLYSMCQWFRHVLGHYMASFSCKGCGPEKIEAKKISSRTINCGKCNKTPTLKIKKPFISKCFNASDCEHACRQCKLKLPTKELLETHLKLHPKRSEYNCAHCGEILSSRDAITVHITTLHTSRFKLKCPDCEKEFLTSKLLRRHSITMHTNEKPFKCGKCPKSYATRSTLTTHLMKHDESHKKFPCIRCDKSFMFLSHLKRHVKGHTGQRDFKCVTCGEEFTTKFGLQRHAKSTHTFYRPFQCDSCGQRFHRKCNLQQHQVVHTQIKAFQCQFCKVCFTQKGGLTRHMEKHDPTRPFECQQCPEKFALMSSLSIHVKKIHDVHQGHENMDLKDTN